MAGDSPNQAGGVQLATNPIGRAATESDVLINEHGRRFGIGGDGQPGNTSFLMLDRRVIASNRMSVPFIAKVVGGINGAGAITLANAVAGDTVISASSVGVSGTGDVSADFEATISVTGQIQQLANNHNNQFILVIVFPRS